MNTDTEGRQTFENIIATHNSSASRRLVLACHYDSKKYIENFVAASDSAVPCGILLHVAQTITPLLNNSTEADRVTLQLLFFDGEEAFRQWTATDSLYGSRYHAARLERNGQLHNIDALLLLDLIGFRNPVFHPTPYYPTPAVTANSPSFKNNRIVQERLYNTMISIGEHCRWCDWLLNSQDFFSCRGKFAKCTTFTKYGMLLDWSGTSRVF